MRVGVRQLRFLTRIALGNILASVGKKARPVVSLANQLNCPISTKVASCWRVMGKSKFFRAES